MADNYLDVPVLIEKLKAAGTIAAGDILATNADKTGFIAYANDSVVCGMMALEPATSGNYFSALIFGTALFKVGDTAKAGVWVAPDTTTLNTVERWGTTVGCRSIGTLIDGAAAAVTARTARVLLRGTFDVLNHWGDT